MAHFTFFGYPNETVFDEVHFGKFVSGYYTGEYFFDIHPPLGKLTIAGFAKAFDFKPEFNFAKIGEEFPDNKYLALRFLPVLAGALLPLIIFLLIKELGMSNLAAFTGGLLVVFDNALLVQSGFILLDSFLLLFGFSSLLFYFKRRYLLMAAFGGLAISIKWTGLSFIALPLIIEGYKNLKERKFFDLAKFTCCFLVSLTIYFSVFAVHFSLLPKPGPGDAFMASGFREENIIKNFWDLNLEMYRSNQRITATHPYSSPWYKWPLAQKPIFYWVKDSAKIYLQGNPVIWLAGTASILYLVFSILYLKVLKKDKKYQVQNVLYILLTGYAFNLLPFIGVKRVMFLYHYLAALIFAILIMVYLIDKTKSRQKIFTGLVIASIVAFLYLAPTTYGLP